MRAWSSPAGADSTSGTGTSAGTAFVAPASDGTPIPKAHRRAYLRHLAEGNPPLPSPFAMKDHFERLASAA